MEVSIADLTEIDREVSIQATSAELAPHFDEAFRKQRAKIELKGFRKGKAPLDLIRKLYGESIEYDSLTDIANEFYRQAMEERKIQPIGEPVLTDMSYKPGEPFSFKVKFQIKPTITLKDYRGVAAERVKHVVTNKEIDDELHRIRRSNAKSVEAEIAESDEHVVIADIQELDAGGSPIIGKKSGEVRIYLADETVYPEIKTALRGIAVGGEARATINRTVEEKQELVHLQLTARKIERVELPELNDEFVRMITKNKVGTAEAFMTGLRNDITRFWDDRTDRKLTDAIVGEIVRRHEVPVPESMVKGILDSMIEDMAQRYPGKKLPADFNDKEFREQNREFATFQAKWYLLRERLIEAEGITATDADFEQRAELDAPSMGIDSKRLLEFYRTSESVRDRIISTKLMDVLKQHSAITERSTEEAID
jgi:trigger factor